LNRFVANSTQLNADMLASGMDVAALRSEIARNFDAFQRTLSVILPAHQDRFALLRHGMIVDFYNTPGAADGAGSAKFSDGLYSIQQVTEEPVGLGLYANAAD
jgi:hypothetical protein